MSPARLPFRHFGSVSQFSIVERTNAVNPGTRYLLNPIAICVLPGPTPTSQPFISSSNFVTVRQFLPVLIVASFESK